MQWKKYYEMALQQDPKGLARCISLIENEEEGHLDLLRNLPSPKPCKVVGITGPPGAGKSTLTDRLIEQYIAQDQRVAILCVDPSSPFHLGALLGDRIRMSNWYTHPKVFIRSLASRGALGGLHPHIIEITDLLRCMDFDTIIIETVGVGQSEIEIAGLADITVVVLVPEAGDEVQTMKAGLMEIANIFVVNKSDRPDANTFSQHLELLAHASGRNTPVIKTIAQENKGIDTLAKAIENEAKNLQLSDRRFWLLAERAYQLIRKEKMKDISRIRLRENIEAAVNRNDFNMYSYIEQYKEP